MTIEGIRMLGFRVSGELLGTYRNMLENKHVDSVLLGSSSPVSQNGSATPSSSLSIMSW